MIPDTRQPKPDRSSDAFPFGSGEHWRPLRLVLDDESLTEEDIAEMLNFGHFEEIELIRTAAPALPRLEIQEPDEDFVPIHTVTEHGTGILWVWHAARQRERARATAAEIGTDEDAAYRRLVFAAASEQIEADGFVSRSEFLRSAGTSRDFSVYTPVEAIALIGLALRLHGNQSIGADLVDLRLSGSTFHFVLARELTREGWRWFSACAHHSRECGDDTAINLGQAALERLQRVLQIRDRLHAQAKIPSNPTVGDELVFQFETLMLFLSATFDAVARVAHLAYFGRDYEDAGWRRPGWNKQLTKVEPALAALVCDDNPGGTVLRLISRMRNKIHGEALRTLTLQRSGAPTENPVEMDANDAGKTIDDIRSLGDDPIDWGIREEHGRTYLAADRYAEALLPHAVGLLNELMAGTAIERLPNVDATKLMSPPADVPSVDPLEKMFSWEIRRRVRRLGGF